MQGSGRGPEIEGKKAENFEAKGKQDVKDFPKMG
jgi:hypothetical protein